MDNYYPKSETAQNIYQPPEEQIAPVMRFADWLAVLVISFIPVANIIVLSVWALSDKGNPNRRNFARAMLLLIAAYIVLMVFYFGYIAGMFYQLGTMLQ